MGEAFFWGAFGAAALMVGIALVTGVTTDSSNEVALDLGGVNDNVGLGDIKLVL